MVAAFEAGGSLEEVLQRLTAQPGTDPTQPQENSASASHGGASSSAPLPDNVDSDIAMNEVEDPSITEQRDVEMEDELSADIAKADALADYDIEVNVEGEAITEYLSLVESAGSCGKTAPSQ